MAQLTAVIATRDQDFRTNITRRLRSSGLSISVVADERHLASGTGPDLVVSDIRAGFAAVQSAIERVRGMWAAADIIAVAAGSEPEHILQAMRAGANEFVSWPVQQGQISTFDENLRTALTRAAERAKARTGDRRTAQTLSFFGAKGGAGTTTLAVNTAIDIARTSGRPTLIIDLHQFLGEVALFLGVRPRFTTVDAIDNLHRLDAEFLRELVVRHKSGLDILAGSEQVDRPGPQDAPAVEQLLQILSRNYEYIVIDAGTVTSVCAEVAVYAADTIYVVANPDVPSIRNTQRLVDRICQLGADRDHLRVVLNRTSDQHLIAPKQIETALGHPIVQAFASDYNTVSAALNAGVPLTLSNHTELASQFSHFTNGILHRDDAAAAAASGERRRTNFLGLF
jgi:pilus assembly protein CpaE